MGIRNLLFKVGSAIFAGPSRFLKFHALLLSFFLKVFLIYYYRSYINALNLIWIPSFFIPDIIVTAIGCLVIWTIQKSFKESTIKKCLLFFILLLFNVILMAINTLGLSSVNRTGFIISWSSFICSIGKNINDTLFWKAEAIPILKMLAVHIAIMFTGLIISICLNRLKIFNSYKIMSENSMEVKRTFNHKNSPKKLYTIVIFVLYSLISFVFRSDEKFEPSLISNQVINLIYSLNEYYYNSCQIVHYEFIAGKNHLIWYNYCHNIDQILRQHRSQVQVCFPNEKFVSDFSFLNRTEKSPIKNVVLMFLESIRKEMMPFNYSSKFANETLIKKAINEDITPFMREIIKKSRYSTHAKSVCSYSVKAFIGGLCSTYPYPENYSIERKYKFYKRCLPELLAKFAGMRTTYIQPAFTSHFDVEKISKMMGFQEIIGAEVMNSGKLGPHPNRYHNPFGYEDGLFLKVIQDWVKKQVNESKNFFLTYFSAITHEPFHAPPNWTGKLYSNNEKHNKYINTLAYADQFLKNVIDSFKEQGLLENTLFVFLGDHGLSLGEHNVWYATDVPYEEVFSIPMMFYTENKEWNRRFPPGRVEEPWFTLDVTPTILDALQFDGTDKKFQGNYDYEGQSLLRGKYQRRMQLSFANPGISAIIAREHDWKIIMIGIGWRPEKIYNLKDDEYEKNSLSFKSLEPEVMNWVEDTEFIREIFILKVKKWYEDSAKKNNPPKI